MFECWPKGKNLTATWYHLTNGKNDPQYRLTRNINKVYRRTRNIKKEENEHPIDPKEENKHLIDPKEDKKKKKGKQSKRWYCSK